MTQKNIEQKNFGLPGPFHVILQVAVGEKSRANLGRRGERAHWALEYGYLTLKTPNTKLWKRVENVPTFCLKTPVMNQNCFKDVSEIFMQFRE